jgi:hypothetical protein
LLHELNIYIGSALAKGSAAIIIATQDHLDTFAHALKRNGIDISKATVDGRYIPLNATEFLSKFMVEGVPDPRVFTEVVGGVINRAAEASHSKDHRLVAFGEMVALLWAEGQPEAALKVRSYGMNWRRSILSLCIVLILCRNFVASRTMTRS